MQRRIFLALFPIVVASALLQVNCGPSSAADMSGTSLVTAQSLSRSDVQKRLQRLAASAAPAAVSEATQREPAPLPDLVEYTCPICGSKTQYKRPSTGPSTSRSIGQDQGWSWMPAADTRHSRLADELEKEEEKAAAWSTGDMVANQIPACRRLAKEIRDCNLSVKLDETLFCRKCSSGSDQAPPYLVLIIHYAGEKETRHLKHVKANELRLIAEFIGGKRIHVAADGSQSPLKNYTKRLEFLLGVQIPQQ